MAVATNITRGVGVTLRENGFRETLSENGYRDLDQGKQVWNGKLGSDDGDGCTKHARVGSFKQRVDDGGWLQAVVTIGFLLSHYSQVYLEADKRFLCLIF
ncbi:hypothetical protein RIF29_08420 [Crotalaria pallida]|uniref:Uncharacterized protein n=1 Tax=Crotalaria pallida TaxID=3830 RepID=A0AAN9FQR1_CROPI